MGLLDDEEFLKKKRKPNLLANVQQLQRPAEPYLRQQYPEVYGGLGGLLGMAPDEMAGSILDPNTARVRAGAQIGFPVGTAAQVAPLTPMLATGAKATAKALGPTAVSMGEGYLQRQGLMPGVVPESGAIPRSYDGSSVLMNPKNLTPLNKIEDANKYKNILSSMQESGYQGRPILAYMDKGKAKALTGSHRLYAARNAGIDVPVVFVKPSVMKWEDKEGLFGSFKESINDQRVYEHLKAAGDDTAASLVKLEDSIDQPSPFPQQAALDLAQQQDAAPDLLQYQQMLDEEERKKLGGLLFR